MGAGTRTDDRAKRAGGLTAKSWDERSGPTVTERRLGVKELPVRLARTV